MIVMKIPTSFLKIQFFSESMNALTTLQKCSKCGIFADESLEIFLPEIAMGLIPGAGGTVSLPRRIGAQKTLFLAITGRKLAFEEAGIWGLVDEAYGWQT